MSSCSTGDNEIPMSGPVHFYVKDQQLWAILLCSQVVPNSDDCSFKSSVAPLDIQQYGNFYGHMFDYCVWILHKPCGRAICNRTVAAYVFPASIHAKFHSAPQIAGLKKDHVRYNRTKSNLLKQRNIPVLFFSKFPCASFPLLRSFPWLPPLLHLSSTQPHKARCLK